LQLLHLHSCQALPGCLSRNLGQTFEIYVQLVPANVWVFRCNEEGLGRCLRRLDQHGIDVVLGEALHLKLLVALVAHARQRRHGRLDVGVLEVNVFEGDSNIVAQVVVDRRL